MEFSPESHWAEKYITHPWEWEKTLINRIWESNNTMLDETMNGIKNNVFDQIENKILLESLINQEIISKISEEFAKNWLEKYSYLLEWIKKYLSSNLKDKEFLEKLKKEIKESNERKNIGVIINSVVFIQSNLSWYLKKYNLSWNNIFSKAKILSHYLATY